MDYFVGLDVSLRSVSVCFVDNDGAIELERSVPCEVVEVSACLKGFGRRIERVGFKAGVMSQQLFDRLRAHGFDVVCMEARQVSAALSAMRNKIDKHDTPGIVQLVRSGWYRPVHMKSRASQYARALVTSRTVVLRKCLDLDNEIRGC